VYDDDDVDDVDDDDDDDDVDDVDDDDDDDDVDEKPSLDQQRINNYIFHRTNSQSFSTRLNV